MILKYTTYWYRLIHTFAKGVTINKFSFLNIKPKSFFKKSKYILMLKTPNNTYHMNSKLLHEKT